MNLNYKFHALAIASLSAIIVILFVLIGPKSAPPVEQVVQANGRSIEMVSATWGSNCNHFIESELAKRESVPLAKDAKGQLIPAAPIKKVEMNNVLPKLSALCNGKLGCQIYSVSDTLGFEPLATCFKRLEVSYRCYSYDRLSMRDVGQGETLTINCNAPAKKPAAQ